MLAKNSNEFVFNTQKLEYKAVVDKIGKKRFYVKGHITTGDLDIVNDIITEDCMRDISTQFKGMNIKLDFDHETLTGETELEKNLALTKIPLGKALHETVDAKGNFVEFELNPNWKKMDSKGNITMTFKEVWESIESKFFDAFSIAYVPIRTAQKTIGSIKARLLDKVNIINIALTGNPINPNATMTSIMAKSLQHVKALEGKAYEKDGAHTHTDNELGLHTHPEIEKVINSMNDFLMDRIRDLEVHVFSSHEDNSLSGKSIKRKGDTMTDETNESALEGAKQEKPAEESPTPKDSETTEGGESKEEGSGESTPEAKSLEAKAIDKLTAEIKSYSEEVKSLTKKVEDINKVLEQARPAAMKEGAEAKSRGQAEAQPKEALVEPLDML